MFLLVVECRRCVFVKSIWTSRWLEFNVIKSMYQKRRKLMAKKNEHERFEDSEAGQIKVKRKGKKKRDQQPEATPNASCTLFQFTHCVTAWGPPFFIPTGRNSCFARCCTLDDLLGHSSVWSEERGGGRGGASSRSPPSPLAPARSLRRRSPRTSGRRWRPDGTCSSAPRPLFSTVWSPA